ncbi:hypothetical protein DHW03_16670 [Pedobacter yonginense]|uniref:Exostosin GT47 domain-containing protein n=1 Tax=Pedobacter yonginense TaxID=651869 RepID=A0A317EIM7_9SPHI|nr:exostosin family protein [Pedobacter yonginense]PWS26414.1 hypothetical protein DHW03_16670 [Pedobacter yonginense]
MKIYILPVEQHLQPPSQSFVYPNHNIDYGVEQDFLIYLNKNPQLITKDAKAADWHYLPVFWTRWHINHNFAENGDGLDALNPMVENVLIDSEKTFTITQFDGGTLLTATNILEFTAARTTNEGIDIPILCALHKHPLFPIKKKYIGSFNGSVQTHPLRQQLFDFYQHNPEINLGGNLPTRFYKRWIQGKQFNLNIMASHIALCPRGTSANSFRFFEAMQLGVAPCLIGDLDVRPFQKYINWDDYSYYVKDIKELSELVENLNPQEAKKKGKAAKALFYNDLYYQKWCKYVVKELNDHSN